MRKRWGPAHVVATGLLWAMASAADEITSSPQLASNLLLVGCYFEASGFQSLAVEYLLGKGQEESKEQISASDLPEERKQKLIAATQKVYSDKPADYEEYGARVFMECSQRQGIQVSAERVSACFADSWVLGSAIRARTSHVPMEQVIAHHRDCQAFGCKNKGLDTQSVIEQVYAAQGSLDVFPAARFRHCVQEK